MVKPDKPHYFWNADREEAHVLVQVWPARRFELLIETLFGLAHDGKTNAKGVPNLLQLAVIAQEFDREIRFTKPPRIAQRRCWHPCAPGTYLRIPCRLSHYSGTACNRHSLRGSSCLSVGLQ
jgi:hypothetical protein